MEKMMLAAAKTKIEPGIELITVPIPKIGEEEVLVKVMATGLCGSDIHTYLWEKTMHYKEKYLPLILGHEFSGQVVEVGRKVKTVKVGDRILAKPSHPCGTCWFCRNHQPNNCTNRSTCGSTKAGAFAEYCAIYEDQVVHMPDNMTWEQGAIIEPLGVGTNCAIRADIDYGDFVVVSGPGPIGLVAVLAAGPLGRAGSPSSALPETGNGLGLGQGAGSRLYLHGGPVRYRSGDQKSHQRPGRRVRWSVWGPRRCSRQTCLWCENGARCAAPGSIPPLPPSTWTTRCGIPKRSLAPMLATPSSGRFSGSPATMNWRKRQRRSFPTEAPCWRLRMPSSEPCTRKM